MYIGDGLQDFTAATRANLQFLGITSGLVTTQEFAENGARSIDSLALLRT